MNFRILTHGTVFGDAREKSYSIPLKKIIGSRRQKRQGGGVWAGPKRGKREEGIKTGSRKKKTQTNLSREGGRDEGVITKTD